MTKIIKGVIFLSFLLLSTLITEPMYGYEKLTKTSNYWELWGVARKISIDGNYAYVSTGESDVGVEIIDISDPNEPKRAGGISTFWTYNVTAKDNIAFVAPRLDRYIYIYDCVDKANPVLLKKIDTGITNLTVKISGNILVAGPGPGSPNLSQLYEISDPRNPKLISEFPDIKIEQIEGNTAYGIQSNNLFITIDLSAPNYPVSVKGTVTGNFLYAFQNYVYFGVPAEGIAIYRITDFTKVNTVQMWTGEVMDDNYRGFKVVGKYAYFINKGSGFVEPSGFNYLMENSGFWVLDVSNPERPVVVGRWGQSEILQTNVPVRFENMEIKGDFAYVIDSFLGMRVFNISDPFKPVPISTFKAGGEMVYACVTDTRIYIAKYLSGGITILDRTNPEYPKYLGYIHPGASIYHFACYNDDYLYFDTYDDEGGSRFGFYIVDVRDSKNPVIADRKKIGDMIPIGVKDNLLLTAVEAYSLDDPLNPVFITKWPVVISFFNDVLFQGNYAFTYIWREYAKSDNFKIFDVTDFSQPKEVASLTIPYNAELLDRRSMQIIDNKLYISSAGFGISVIDISDPRQPRIIDNYDGFNTSGDYYGFHIKDKFLYTFHYGRENNGVVYDILYGLENAQVIQNVPGMYTWHTLMKDDYIYAVRLNGLDTFKIKKDVEPVMLDFGSDQNQQIFNITNTGAFPLTWNIGTPVYKDGSGWISSISPSSVILNPGENAAIAVSVDRTDFCPGTYVAKIPVISDRSSQDILITMIVPEFKKYHHDKTKKKEKLHCRKHRNGKIK